MTKNSLVRKTDLYDEKTFYQAFIKDLNRARKEVIIYCPFVTKFRLDYFRQVFDKLKSRKVAVFVFTRPLHEHETIMRNEVRTALDDYKDIGVSVVHLPGFIHAKTAIIDSEILWDGSLNILSQRESREMMRRTKDEDMAKQVMDHLGLSKKLAEGYKYRRLAEKPKGSFAVLAKIVKPASYLLTRLGRLLSVIPKIIVLCLKCISVLVTLFS